MKNPFGSDYKKRVALACCLCRGSKELRHDVPAEVDPDRWARQCILNACPLCKGTGEQPFVRNPMTGQATPVPVFLIETKVPGKVIVACIDPNCRKWADATPFFHTGLVTEKDPIARCPDGHTIRMNITVDGIRKD